jgi:hypothetical protein
MCLVCQSIESKKNKGAQYTSNGDNGMIVSFWLCDACAVKLGPGQGPIDIEEEASQKK